MKARERFAAPLWPTWWATSPIFSSVSRRKRQAILIRNTDRPMRIFAAGFGAGAVAGYVLMRVDRAIIEA